MELSVVDAKDMPRHQPPLPTVTTSRPAVTQRQQFGHAASRQRPPAERPGQLGGKTVTVRAVCRSDIQGQKGGAGTLPTLTVNNSDESLNSAFMFFWSEKVEIVNN